MNNSPKCPCGLPRLPKHTVCNCCWKAAPNEVRSALSALYPGERRNAARQLLRFAQERGRQIELSPTKK